MRIFHIGVNLINGIPVIQCRFKHKRTRFVDNSRSIECSLNQHFMNQMPRRIVTDSHFAMNNQPIRTSRLAVVHRVRRHDKGVRNRNHLIFRCTDTGNKRSTFQHVARRIVQFDAVACLIRTHIGDNQSGDNVTDNRARTKRCNQTDEHRNTLEYTGTCSRKIGINHSHHERIKQETHDVVGRQCPIGIEPVDFQPLTFHFTGKVAHKAHQIFDSQTNDNDGKQIGNIGNNSHQDAFHRYPQIAQQRIGKFLGLRENDEHKRNREQQLHEHKQIARHVGGQAPVHAATNRQQTTRPCRCPQLPAVEEPSEFFPTTDCGNQYFPTLQSPPTQRDV